LIRFEFSPGAYALIPSGFEDDGFVAAFTERSGGASTEPRFASLNLSYSSGDDPRYVSSNRYLVTRELGTGPFAVGGQVHGATLALIEPEQAGSGFEGPEGVIGATDGLHSSFPGVALAVATADCAPIILGSAREERLAVIHAGWRGIAAGIVEAAARLFDDPTGVRATIGPCAGVCCYEVGGEVVEAIEAGPGGSAVTRRSSGRVFLDIPSTIERGLRELGVRDIEPSGVCTIDLSDRFFSHRRDGPCGRQLAIAMRL
jgi:hypothetical protein